MFPFLFFSFIDQSKRIHLFQFTLNALLIVNGTLIVNDEHPNRAIIQRWVFGTWCTDLTKCLRSNYCWRQIRSILLSTIKIFNLKNSTLNVQIFGKVNQRESQVRFREIIFIWILFPKNVMVDFPVLDAFFRNGHGLTIWVFWVQMIRIISCITLNLKFN